MGRDLEDDLTTARIEYRLSEVRWREERSGTLRGKLVFGTLLASAFVAGYVLADWGINVLDYAMIYANQIRQAIGSYVH